MFWYSGLKREGKILICSFVGATDIYFQYFAYKFV